MPFVSATLAVTPSDELTARAIAALTDLTVEILGKERARTTVVVQYVPAGQWARGGVPLPVRGYFVDVWLRRGGRAPRGLVGVCGRNPGASLPEEQGRLE